jgi:hypothetical protein
MFEVGSGVTILTSGSAAPAGVPTAAAGAVLSVAGLRGVKKFCFDFAKNGINTVIANKNSYKVWGADF